MFLNSSIARKQTVATTGILLILFIVAHLGGNLLIYAGPGVFNAYAYHLHSLGPLLWLIRFGLLAVFLVHISLTSVIVIENIKARGGLQRYAVEQSSGPRSLAERLMPYSGLYLLIFVIFHILDIACVNPQGPLSFIHGKSYGLYGLVFNLFKDPVYGLLYIMAMCFLGLHLCHGVQSVVQTNGFRPKWAAWIKIGSDCFALLMVVGFSSIPVYVYLLSSNYVKP